MTTPDNGTIDPMYDERTGEPYDQADRDDDLWLSACTDCWYVCCEPSCPCGCHRG